MDPVDSVICNGTIVIGARDFMLISMGCGIGYFVSCYIIVKRIYDYCKKRNLENQTVIPAIQV